MNRWKLAAINRENHEGHLRISKAWVANVPIIQENYITQVSGEIKGRVTKKLSKDFSRTESRILGALSKPDEFSPKAQLRVDSRNTTRENQEPIEDRSQTDPEPETGVPLSQSPQNCFPDDPTTPTT